MQPHEYLWAGLVFAVAAASDWYDGYFARLWQRTSSFGAFLDPLADKILTGTAFIAFASAGLVPVWTVWIVIARDVLMTLFRLLSDSLGMTIRTSSFGKVKTFIQMAFITYVLLVHIFATGDIGSALQGVTRVLGHPDVYYYGMIVVTILTVATKAQYIYDNMQVLRAAAAKYLGIRSAQKL
jgi:CDP-diacylglycerol--glycerol-3-phosphate 3-phosphatidyltransferase